MLIKPRSRWCAAFLAYAENRLRMDPVPLDKGTQPAADLYKALNGVIRDRGRAPVARTPWPRASGLHLAVRRH